jgi:hypothetical protein
LGGRVKSPDQRQASIVGTGGPGLAGDQRPGVGVLTKAM